jgi:ferredoxin-NADP reductase
VFTFLPGQFTIFKIKKNINRAYSIASHPKKLPFWEVIVDITPGGPGSTYLKNLKIGQLVSTTKPSGRLYFQEDKAENVLCFATGCGIASIKPIIEESITKKSVKNVCLVWGLRYQKDIILQSELEKLKKNPKFDYFISLSKDLKNNTCSPTGRITKQVDFFINKFSFSKTSCYLCGNKDMIEDITRKLLSLKVNKNRIYFEKYY